MSLALETRETPIRIVGSDGVTTIGALFLHAVGDHGGVPESIGDRLNDLALSFLPVRAAGRVELLNLAAIAYIALPGRSEDVARREAIGASRTRVELELVSGETVAGDLLYLMPSGHSRVSDLLNSPGERFLLLLGSAETLYVHRTQIRRAWGG